MVFIRFKFLLSGSDTVRLLNVAKTGQRSYMETAILKQRMREIRKSELKRIYKEEKQKYDAQVDAELKYLASILVDVCLDDLKKKKK